MGKAMTEDGTAMNDVPKLLSADPTGFAAIALDAWAKTVGNALDAGPVAEGFAGNLADWAGKFPQDRQADETARRRTRCRNMIGAEFGLYAVTVLSLLGEPASVGWFRNNLAIFTEDQRTADRLIEALAHARLADREPGRRRRRGTITARPAARALLRAYRERLATRGLPDPGKPVVNRVLEIKGAWQDRMDAHLDAGGRVEIENAIEIWFGKTGASPSWRR